MDLREFWDRIDRGIVVILERQAVRTPFPAAGIVGQRLATTGTARDADRSEEM
jgi:hypothetical protein